MRIEAQNPTEITEADKAELVDIQTVTIDPSQSAALRMESYLEQMKDPYCFLCDDSVVRVRFESSTDLADKLKNYYISIKKC